MSELLPNVNSANYANKFIRMRNQFLGLIINGVPVSHESTKAFEIKLDTVFPDEIAPHVEPSE
jgi:hypothetical protein